MPTLPALQPNRSMADTLQASFGDSDSRSAAHIQRAYAKLQAFGL